MRAFSLSLIAVSWTSLEVAAQDRADLQRLVDMPDTFIGKRIVVPSVNCVDDPKGGYVCARSVGGQKLRLQAGALGTKTGAKIAERLLGDCKGTANLKRAACRVDAEIEPSRGTRDITETPSGSMPITVIDAPSIEMYEAVSKKRIKRQKAATVSPKSPKP
ncbi:hypothetical protein [Methylobacterium haplocladii]|uniref:Uncharacterized protein n=1 Tax=Methylobacterium haplocladii TaxID=1176176 RepID=A0A512IK42_9HYPH|nr:hypothetical protein [Methylobacterium haplocladii]GEO98051.1 hypothetical protein MHA02_04390 [Methylobacterium haplocladii]GJD85672.1 hypothetical protein HPGCJGGD_3563 [Methylobacterium haplocladii]GLS60096.1 hypothetical protein GCM10007887_27730 [Methylobacterium haplocladii]